MAPVIAKAPAPSLKAPSVAVPLATGASLTAVIVVESLTVSAL